MAEKLLAGVLPSSRLANVRYAEKEYWNTRYTSQPCEFDWFYGYVALRKVVRNFIKRSKPVLHVGCGNSNFQEGMAKDGYQVINTDISDVVIEQMKAKHKHMPSLRYVVSDCRSMPEFLDFQFGSVIDKGTVDALLCCKDAANNIRKMFKEISRVLIPGGVFLLITLGAPAQRLALVNQSEFDWTVQVCLVRRVSEDQFAPSEPGRAIPLNDTARPLSYIGPLEVLPDGTVAGLPEPFEPSSYFYVYICRKAPLVLPTDNTGGKDEKVRLPDGWKAAVRAVAQVVDGELGLPQGILGRGRRVKLTSRASFERKQRERELERQLQREQSCAVEAPSARGQCSQLAPPPQQLQQEQEQMQEQMDGDGGGGTAYAAAAGSWGSNCPASAVGQQQQKQDTSSATDGSGAGPGSQTPGAITPLASAQAAAMAPAAAAAATAPIGHPAMSSVAAPSPASRLGALHLSHAISYRRLSATVQDAFAQLDAVDGECSNSCSNVDDFGDTAAGAWGSAAEAPRDLDVGVGKGMRVDGEAGGREA